MWVSRWDLASIGKERTSLETCAFSLFPLTPPNPNLSYDYSTGLPLSTYFSAIKLRWMLDHLPEVQLAHESDDLLFGTVESWVAYVS